MGPSVAYQYMCTTGNDQTRAIGISKTSDIYDFFVLEHSKLCLVAILKYTINCCQP
jgi:hypothetical protein